MTGISYEKLFEILRSERSDAKITQLPETYFSDLIEYLKTKEHILSQPAQDINVAQQEISQQQLRNVKKILQEIYNRREKKIITLAITKSRTNTHLVETANLLPEEKKFFEELVELFRNYRHELVQKILVKELPFKGQFHQMPEESGIPTYQFTEDVPEFVGPDMQQYGPYKKDDTAILPQEVANVLLNQNQVKEA